MPGDNDHLLFDYHTHHGTEHNITHSHDDHPRHRHDANGSVIYLADLAVGIGRDLHAAVDNLNRRTDGAAPIGTGGYDITHRTR